MRATSSVSGVEVSPLYVAVCICKPWHRRERIASALGVPTAQLELSMGMSGDFEQAVRV
jgi:hypothetical protein